MLNAIGNTKALNDIRVVYYDSDIMFAGTEGDCLSFLEGAKEIYPHISSWKCSTVEEYGSECYDTGREYGYDAGYETGYQCAHD